MQLELFFRIYIFFHLAYNLIAEAVLLHQGTPLLFVNRCAYFCASTVPFYYYGSVV